MRKLIQKIAVALAIALTSGSAAAICQAANPTIVGPLVNANWNNFFPVSILGVQISPSGARDPPLMTRQGYCYCPSSFFGYYLPGFIITYWMPRWVYEAEDEPGCYPTFSSQPLLTGYEGQRGTGQTISESINFKRNGHLLDYPLFALLNMFTSSACKDSNTGVNLAYTTEVDSMWHSDVWSAVLSPEAELFNNVVATLACIPDAVASSLGYPLDALFWCVGGKNIYPLAGGVEKPHSNEAGNMASMTKFLGRHHRAGAMWQAIGPSAICSTHYNPVISKSQYRPDPIWPFPKGYSAPVVIGQHPLLWGTVGNIPTQEGTSFQIWRAVQCCVRF